MVHPEKYARPGVYRDDDDHAKLLDENREAYERERRERLVNEIEENKRKLEEMKKRYDTNKNI